MADEQPDSPLGSTKTVESPLAPIGVTVIGTMRDYIPKDGTIATTVSAESPNLRVTTVQPLVAMAIRFGNLFASSLLGTLSIKMAPSSDNMVIQAIQLADFWSIVVAGASVAASAACYGLLKDVVTITSGWEKTHPLSTGSI